ncbi:hypothetical protein CD122_08450 [Staphylococcus rostri]|uniref:Uncharacterized protein n=1 Tax=Staphylococcus rostri TaxID=522262 RepID=A0A2K3YL41_9STAP|nr:hypothetical protein CD122_08450 [Staphylococcus rostri]
MFLTAYCCRFLQIIRNKFATVFSKLVESVFFEQNNHVVRSRHLSCFPTAIMEEAKHEYFKYLFFIKTLFRPHIIRSS